MKTAFTILISLTTYFSYASNGTPAVENPISTEVTTEVNETTVASSVQNNFLMYWLYAGTPLMAKINAFV